MDKLKRVLSGLLKFLLYYLVITLSYLMFTVVGALNVVGILALYAGEHGEGWKATLLGVVILFCCIGWVMFNPRVQRVLKMIFSEGQTDPTVPKKDKSEYQQGLLHLSAEIGPLYKAGEWKQVGTFIPPSHQYGQYLTPEGVSGLAYFTHANGWFSYIPKDQQTREYERRQITLPDGTMWRAVYPTVGNEDWEVIYQYIARHPIALEGSECSR